MHQILDFFNLLDPQPGIEWRLSKASTNSPLHIEAEAVSLEASVDVSVVARAQKQNLAKSLREITKGKLPTDPNFSVKAAKKLFARNLNGIGATEIDFELGDPITLTPIIAQEAIRTIERKTSGLFDIPSAREEVGSIEGTLQDVGTHNNYPAVKIQGSPKKESVWCRLSIELQSHFQDKATYKDVWQHQRVIIRGTIKYNEDGEIQYVLANDIRRIDPRDISLEAIKDPHFTGGLSVVDYLDRFRDGALG